MALSRRQVAQYAARQLAEGAKSKTVAAYLAAYIAENKAVRFVDLLMSDIEYFLQKDHQHATVHVYSAYTLSSDIKKSLLRQLQLQPARTELNEHIDESLIGGVTISTAGKEFDSSLKSALKKLTTIANEGV